MLPQAKILFYQHIFSLEYEPNVLNYFLHLLSTLKLNAFQYDDQ